MEGPRVGKLSVAGDFYVSETEEALTRRLDKHFNILQAIEARGLGSSRVLAIAKCWADRAAPNEHWYRVLGTAKDVKETREVARAVAEWSDAESIGAHYAYGNDLFCTLDVAAPITRHGDALVLMPIVGVGSRRNLGSGLHPWATLPHLLGDLRWMLSNRPQKITFADMRAAGVCNVLIYFSDCRCSPFA